MVESPAAKLIACGFSFELSVNCIKDSWADCVVVLKCQTTSQVLDMRSTPFYMSRDDFGRLADHLTSQSSADCEDRFPFVPLNLGFELSIVGADENEATLQVHLNVGICDGNRIYAGCRSQVQVAKLRKFGASAAALAKRVFLS